MRNTRDLTHKSNVDRMIAKAIIRAQSASDTGKDIDELETRTSLLHVSKHLGYGVKTFYIMDAIRRINGSPRPTAFTYYVEEQGRYLLVYFGVRLGQGCRKIHEQVSFHIPKYEAKEFGIDKFVGKGTKMHWNHDLGGSRRTCQMLINRFYL